ncbi:MAG: hypothetical protein ACYDHP_02275 [Ferrimicrobium sp.]
MSGFPKVAPAPPPTRLYRHSAAGAVIAIVTILTVLSHGHVRHFLIGVLIVLLAIAVGVFFHGHLMSLVRSLRRNNRAQIFLHRGEDFIGALGPDKGLGTLIPSLGPLGNPSS